MIELRIIIPAEPPTGNLEALEYRLCEAFGGYTCTKGRGAWRDDDGATVNEPVLIYDVAARKGTGGLGTLWTIARWAAREFSQQSIYIRGVDGIVQLVKRRELTDKIPADPLLDPPEPEGIGMDYKLGGDYAVVDQPEVPEDLQPPRPPEPVADQKWWADKDRDKKNPEIFRRVQKLWGYRDARGPGRNPDTAVI